MICDGLEIKAFGVGVVKSNAPISGTVWHLFHPSEAKEAEVVGNTVLPLLIQGVGLAKISSTPSGLSSGTADGARIKNKKGTLNSRIFWGFLSKSAECFRLFVTYSTCRGI